MEFSCTQVTYLDALGIDVWLPRDQHGLSEVIQAAESAPQLDARAAARAAVSQVLDRPKVQQPSETNATLAVASNSPVPSPLQEPVRSPSQAPTASIQSPVSQVSSTETTELSVPHFHLQFWCYGSGLWLVSSHQSLQPAHHKFVHNLAAYIQGKKRKPKHVGVFSWPMIDAPNIDQSETVAKRYLQQHVNQLKQVSAMEKMIAIDESQVWLSEFVPVCLDTQLDLCLQSATEKQRVWRVLSSHRCL